MTELSGLYQDVILEHNRSPRNFRRMDDADCHAEGRNPLCGDQLTVWLKLSGDLVSDVSFEGSGCAISKASASLMTTAVKGKSRGEIDRMFLKFHELVTGKSPQDESRRELGKLEQFIELLFGFLKRQCRAHVGNLGPKLSYCKPPDLGPRVATNYSEAERRGTT